MNALFITLRGSICLPIMDRKHQFANSVEEYLYSCNFNELYVPISISDRMGKHLLANRAGKHPFAKWQRDGNSDSCIRPCGQEKNLTLAEISDICDISDK